MVKYTILSGGFTSFIATLVFDSVQKNLTVTHQTPTGQNPSWIATLPGNSSVLYAVNELGPVGQVQSFLVDDDGIPHNVDNITTLGNGPTYTESLSTGEVTAVNFGSTNASFIPTDPDDPLRFRRDPATNDLALSSVVNFPIPPGSPSHPHESLEFGGEVLVSDLGADKIWRLGRNDAGNFLVSGQINIDPGAGPRHMALMDNVLLTIHEKTSTLTAQAIPQPPNSTTLPLLANVTVIPPNQPPGAQFFAAEILISRPHPPHYPHPLIYVSNRNIAVNATDRDPRGDAIAIFEFIVHEEQPIQSNVPVNPDEDKLAEHLDPFRRSVHETMLGRRLGAQTVVTKAELKLVRHVFTGLTNIRSMTIGNREDGGDRFLIAGGLTEGGVVVFKRVKRGRDLVEVARTALDSQSCFVFL